MKRDELSMATTRVVTKVVLVDGDSETDKTESGSCSSSPRVCTAVGRRDMNTGMGVDRSSTTMGWKINFKADD
jgi:hypothetical protein